jgi:hypothetical protein
VTQLRKFRDSISNYFDDVLVGIGRRGSSFMDVDAITHDGDTDRFLFQEFKDIDEEIPKGQARLLNALARKDYLTVWCVRKRADGRLDFYDVRAQKLEAIEIEEYRARFARWWGVTAPPLNPTEAPAPADAIDYDLPITAADITW